MTKDGIYLDLNESKYVEVKGGLVFYFSSKLYLNKFKKNVDNFVQTQVAQLEIKYGLKINIELYLIISYYKKIERRGFRVFDDINKKELTTNVLFSNTILSY